MGKRYRKKLKELGLPKPSKSENNQVTVDKEAGRVDVTVRPPGVTSSAKPQKL